ncbi:hypothetical protein DNTS_015805 [Danionella cerebrum]|uniref:EGF-like domain-containing protein n=1 Tax=Danionella cerebrum TaxID=2873325 RepID=A0A553QXA3_9TELE|nr:hypothetical protein DNTS_015805 [Danionella translucida]
MLRLSVRARVNERAGWRGVKEEMQRIWRRLQPSLGMFLANHLMVSSAVNPRRGPASRLDLTTTGQRSTVNLSENEGPTEAVPGSVRAISLNPPLPHKDQLNSSEDVFLTEFRNLLSKFCSSARWLAAGLSRLKGSVYGELMPKLRTMSAGLTLFVSWLICSFVGMESRSPSLSCPSGQFFLKNQCVLCHPSCAECHGHELFECTACALGGGLRSTRESGNLPEELVCSPRLSFVTLALGETLSAFGIYLKSLMIDTSTYEYGKERFLYQGHCRLHCPREFYPDRGQFTCLPCSSNCEICADTRVCAKCREGYRLQSGICLAARCGDGQVQDPDTGECIDCGFGCKTCSTEDSELCSSCSNGYFLSRQQCRKHCPQRTYADEARGLCISCSEPCVDCRSQSLCLTCQTGHFLYNGSCVSQCPVGSYIDSSDRLCQACHSSCESCRGSGPRDCIRCRGSIRPNNGRCPLMRCPSGHFLDVNSGQCRLCAGSCAACFGPAPQNCLSCATGFLLELQSECVESCPLGFYGNESSLVCERCSVNCEACESRDECVSCNTHSYQLYLFQGSCWSQCPDGYFETELGTCEPCEELCLTCDGTSTQCLSCRQGLHLANGQCRQSCASMSYVAEDGTCRRCAPHCDTCRDFTTCTSECLT